MVLILLLSYVDDVATKVREKISCQYFTKGFLRSFTVHSFTELGQSYLNQPTGF